MPALFDVVKLATALSHGLLDEGYCAPRPLDGVAGRAGARHAGRPQRRLVATGPRPYGVPAQIEAMAVESIAMPRAPTHTLRVLAVRPAAGAPQFAVELPPNETVEEHEA